MSTDLNLQSATLPADAVEVGRITSAWGVQGWFKVLTHSTDPQAVLSCRQWYLQPSEKGARTFSGTVLLPIRQSKMHSGAVVALADGVVDRDRAELLRGARIFVPRSAFPQAKADEFYWVDLIGLHVVNREGVALGQVADLLTTGPQTVLVIAFEEAGKSQERMVPFVSAHVDTVDLQGRRITVDWQADF